jgi:hypothetical protein
MQRFALVFLLASLCFSSCKKDDRHAIPSLPGTWQETEQHGQFAGTNHRIVFAEGGIFHLRRTLFTDALEPSNPCGFSRNQYMRGTYSVTESQLNLTGKYCDSAYTVDIADCARGLEFTESHSMTGNFGQLILDDASGDYYRIILNKE